MGPLLSTEAREVTLAELGFRHNERFLCDCDFGALWQHEVRHGAAPADCDRTPLPGVHWPSAQKRTARRLLSPWTFMARRDAVFWEGAEFLDELIEGADAVDRDAVEDMSGVN